MKQLLLERYKAWLYLILLTLGFMVAGWLLTTFHVAGWVWFVTLLVILHVTKARSEGIVLGSAWIMGIIFFGVVFQIWPSILPKKIRWQAVPHDSGTPPKPLLLWPIGYMLLWLFSTLLLLGLAFAHEPLQVLGLNSKQSFYSLIFLSWIGLGIGMLIFKSNLFNFL